MSWGRKSHPKHGDTSLRAGVPDCTERRKPAEHSLLCLLSVAAEPSAPSGACCPGFLPQLSHEGTFGSRLVTVTPCHTSSLNLSDYGTSLQTFTHFLSAKDDFETLCLTFKTLPQEPSLSLPFSFEWSHVCLLYLTLCVYLQVYGHVWASFCPDDGLLWLTETFHFYEVPFVNSWH